MSGARTDDRSITAIVADLTGWPVRQLHDDRRLIGVPGWCVVVRCFETRNAASLADCWRDVAAAAEPDLLVPVLLFRAGPDEWRALWPSALQLWESRPAFWTSYRWTVEAAIEVWAAVAAELVPTWSDAAERYESTEQERQGWLQ